MFYTKTNIKVDLDRLKKDYLLNKDSWTIVRNRFCLNNHTGVDDYVTNAGQKLIYTEYKYMNSEFKNTVWEETLKLLPVKISRARIMIMSPMSLLPIHRDVEPRWHLALFTDPSCVFYDFESSSGIHIPEDGYFYRIDTRRLHTTFNTTTNFDRVHLVINEYV